MILSRRKALVLALGSAAAAAIPMSAFAAVDEAIAAFTGGADVGTGPGITLTAPEIAENGNTVPVGVDAPGAVSILVLAAGNPTPAVATFNFG
jgi:sulfur-oxidizing protein SoxY